MWHKLSLDRTSNLALLVVCLWSGYALYTRPAPAASASQPQRPSLQNGEVLTVSGLQLASKHSTVVLFVRSSCQYCTASMPFYARLRRQMETAADRQGLRLVMVTTDDLETASSYLAQHSLKVDQLLPNTRTPDRIWATPTVVVLSSSGTVKGAWTGQLSEAREGEVLKVLGLS